MFCTLVTIFEKLKQQHIQMKQASHGQFTIHPVTNDWRILGWGTNYLALTLFPKTELHIGIILRYEAKVIEEAGQVGRRWAPHISRIWSNWQTSYENLTI